MPHFIIDCSEAVLSLQAPQKVMEHLFDVANATGLFKPKDIKVRFRPYTYHTIERIPMDFIHVFAYIMEGRNTAQKANLSKEMVQKLKSLYPQVAVISMSIEDFDKASYCNLPML